MMPCRDRRCGKGLIHARVAQRAPDSHRRELARLVEYSLHPDHRVELQERESRGGIVEVHRTAPDSVDEVRRQRVGIDLQTEAGCCEWR